MINLPQETLVKVTFRCDEQNKQKMLNSNCIIHISVGQEYHEGEKFIATMDLINRTFKSCTIMLCDTLQRHSLRIKYPELSDDELYNKALALGDEWLKRNSCAYKYLSIDSKIMRWDEWLNHDEYTKYRKQIDELYKNDAEYRNKIHATINKFLERQGLLNDKMSFKLCETYILEECPILVPLWAQTGCEFIIYPRFRTAAMLATYQYFVGNTERNILQEVALKFNKRTVPKKLSFSYIKKDT
ncbi:MAG: hypothetical protein PVI75_03870 [Gammaproteobacteria bacterium]|jgi:tRNA-dependent cyclodipeptide synthase